MSASPGVLETHTSWLSRLIVILFFLIFVLAALALYLFMTLLFAALVVYAAEQPPGMNSAARAGVVAARVNGAPITDAEVNQELAAAGASAHARSPKLAAEVRGRALEELIVRELVYQDAKRKGLRIPAAEIDRELQNERKRSGTNMATDDKTLRREIERRLLIERDTARELSARTAVSEAEVQSLYRTHRERFRKPEEVRLRAILAALPASPKPEERNAAKQKIEQVTRELKAGGDFAQLAQKYSEDAYRAQGGLIGWVHRGRLDPEVEKVAFALAVGKVSAAFETKYGFLILKVEGKHAARQLSYAEVKEDLRTQLKQEKSQAAREAWISALKKKAKIEIFQNASS